jgi:hypothetical protein
MTSIKLNYFSPSNKTIVTESGFRYTDTDSVLQRQETISGDNDIEIFEQFYKLNNRLRYCNGSYYKFISQEWENKYKEWLNSEDYSQKSFRLYYGNGIVD